MTKQHKAECARVSHRRSDDGGVTFTFPPVTCTCGVDADAAFSEAEKAITFHPDAFSMAMGGSAPLVAGKTCSARNGRFRCARERGHEGQHDAGFSWSDPGTGGELPSERIGNEARARYETLFGIEVPLTTSTGGTT